ncbi:hypothetical protein IC757_11145 [Wenzhouxiangella sp. AB-CW3]|uniref:hypothetical protein n=1 Tax=Wenzhouxiangella sp. AB-CW3 TaxID=2771012 RepID=UPI00168B61A3|nr:hypothetical protein [Wenzhouxiangella sp. AB-CW3]QOC21595.1 hypothetical protein IC757_11145 [Wenzhouxiangella sp. AB-CW3]
MLPIAQRKTLEVPHGLAALAGIICLVLAFANDQAAMEQERQAERGSSSTAIEQVAEEVGSKDQQSPARGDRQQRRAHYHHPDLIPWLPAVGGRLR